MLCFLLIRINYLRNGRSKESRLCVSADLNVFFKALNSRINSEILAAGTSLGQEHSKVLEIHLYTSLLNLSFLCMVSFEHELRTPNISLLNVARSLKDIMLPLLKCDIFQAVQI